MLGKDDMGGGIIIVGMTSTLIKWWWKKAPVSDYEWVFETGRIFNQKQKKGVEFYHRWR